MSIKLAHIVAVAENNVIGNESDLPWDIPEDMEFFKEKTKYRCLIMGRKTFESVGHPLPHRLNIVITRQKDYKSPADNVVIKSNLKEAIDFAKTQTAKYGEEIFIIGGGEIYKESLELVNIIYLTRIHEIFDGDTEYPVLDPNKFELIESRDREEPIPFTFQTYIRK
jgi:dihydrofolate reductase